MLKIAILSSGGGSIARALAKTYQEEYKTRPLVITNNSKSPLLPEALLFDQNNFECALLNKLQEYKCDWLFLAGFMKILSEDFLLKFQSFHRGKNQVVNIHPSLLPNLKGKNAYLRAWQTGLDSTGISLHYVTKEIDAGEIIEQKQVLVERDLKFDDWVEKSKTIEKQIFCNFLMCLIKGKIATNKYKGAIDASL